MLPRFFARSVFSTYARVAASIIVALAVTPILVDGLGRTQYGIWALAGSILVYMELLDFGFAAATTKAVADRAALGDDRAVGRVISTSFWLLMIPGVLALAVAGAVALAFPALFDVPASVEDAARILVLLVAIDLAVSIPSDVFGGALVGVQRYDLLNATLIASTILLAIAWTIVIALDGGLVALGVVTLVIGLGGQLARFLLARRVVPSLSISPREFDRSLLRSLTGLSAWLAITQATTVVIARSGVLIVGFVAGIEEAAVFAVAQKLGVLAERMVMPASSTFFPHAAGLAALEDREGLRRSIVAGTRISVAIAAPICVALSFLAEPALRAWVGDAYAEGRWVVVLMAATAFVKALTETAKDTLSASGFARGSALVGVVEALGGIVLGVVLGSLWGITGVALAAFLVAAGAQLGLLLPFLGRRLALPIRSLLEAALRPHLAALVLAGIVGVVLLALGVSGPVVVLAGATIAGTYVLAFVTIGLGPAERRRLATLIHHRLSRA